MKLALFLLSFLSVVSADEGFFKESYKEKVFKAPAQTKELTSPASATVTITIDVADTVNRVYQSVFSNNTNGWEKKTVLSNQTAIENFKNANIYAMRLPGGNWSNTWLWDETNHWDGSNENGYSGTLKKVDIKKNGNWEPVDYASTLTSRPTGTWSLETEDLLELCDKVGVKPQICVNFALARVIDAPDALQQAAHYAAEWVRDVNIKRGLNVKYWEVGNENYGEWQGGYSVGGEKILASEYGDGFNVFADSMKSADPTIKIGAVVYEDKTGSNVKDWNEDVISRVYDHADFLAVHQYFTWASDLNTIPPKEVLAGLSKIEETIEMLKNSIEEYTPKGREDIPIAMTEYNMRAGFKNTGLVSNLFITQSLGEYIKTGYGLVNIWDLTNGYNEKSGDHGMFSKNHPMLDDYTPQASFYSYYFFAKFFGDNMVQSSSNDEEVNSYASLFTNGYASLVAVNESDKEKNISIDLKNFTKGTVAYMYSVHGEDLEDQTYKVNGVGSTKGAQGPDDYASVEAYKIDFDEEIKITLPKYSSNFIVIAPEKESKVLENEVINDELTLSVYPNPFNPVTNIAFNLPTSGKVSANVYNVKGDLVQKLSDSYLEKGVHQFTFNGNNLSSGVYFLKIATVGAVKTTKMILLK